MRSVLLWSSRLLLLMVICLGLWGCDSGESPIEIDLKTRVSDEELRSIAHKRDGTVLRFGFDLRSGPEEDARQLIPFLRYLEKATGYRFELRFTPKGMSIVDALATGKVQFAAVRAGSYLLARRKYGVISLVRGLNEHGKAQYQSVIVVRPDSPIRKIQDLRGKRFAFGSTTSAQGHIIPRIILAQHGLVNRVAAMSFGPKKVILVVA